MNDIGLPVGGERSGGGAGRNTEFLVSLVIVWDTGDEAFEPALQGAVRLLRERFAFFEVLLVAVEDNEACVGAFNRLIGSAPQTRLLRIEGALSYDDLAVHGYQECIGDIVVAATARELVDVDLDTLIVPIMGGARLVRLRSRTATIGGRLISGLVHLVTGFKVDTRFYRTLCVSRQLLSDVLSAPESLAFFRFTAHATIAGQTVIELDRPRVRASLPLFFRRVDLTVRLLATAAPRLLRYAGFGCALAACAAFTALAYVVAVWFLKRDVVEGWTSLTSLIGLWMFIQLGATSVLCLGLARLLERNGHRRPNRMTTEQGVNDLFGSINLLNVEEN